MNSHRSKSSRLLIASAIVGSLAWHSAAVAQDTSPPAAPPAPSAPTAVEGANTPATVGGQVVTENDIIVTATRTTQRLENVPASIIAVTGKQLDTAGVVRFSDIAMVAPGVMISRSGSYTQPAIRGITTSFAGGGQETNVALYIDGFYQSDQTGMNQDLSNIQGIEILKGPQGTLYGRNATGGAILITTRSPTDRFQAEANVSYAWRFNDKIANLFVGGPIANGIKFSIAASWHKGDGYLRDINHFSRNVALDDTVYTFGGHGKFQYSKYQKRSGNNASPVLNWSVRPKLVLEPTDNLKITLGYVHTLVDENKSQAYFMVGNYPAGNDAAGYNALGVPCAAGSAGCNERATKKFTTSLNFHPISRTAQDEGNATIQWKMGDLGTLTSRTAYRHQTDVNVYELDGTPQNPSQPNPAGTNSYQAVGLNNRKTFTQQLDYNGQFGPMTLLAGFFYYKDRFQSDTTTDSGAAGNPVLNHTDFRTNAWGAYVDQTWNIKDKFFITAGIRYNSDDKKLYVIRWSDTGVVSAANTTYCNSGGIASVLGVNSGTLLPGQIQYGPCTAANHTFAKWKKVKGRAWTPHIVLRYNLSRGTNIYASWSRGFKAATINSSSPFNSLKPETVTAWEAGIKTARGGFRGEASVFYYNYKNNQISAYNGTVTVTSNSGGAHVYGLDLSLSYKVPDMPLNLRGSMGYLHARYTDFDNAGNTTSTGASDLSGLNTTVIGSWTGRRLLRAPDWTASVGADYTLEGVFGGKLVLSATAQYSSRYAPQNASYYCQRVSHNGAGADIPFVAGTQGYCAAGTDHHKNGRFEENGWAQLNAQINWTDASEHYTVGLFANNINNVHYYLANSQPGYGKNILYNEPRAIGVRAGVKF